MGCGMDRLRIVSSVGILSDGVEVPAVRKALQPLDACPVVCNAATQQTCQVDDAQRRPQKTIPVHIAYPAGLIDVDSAARRRVSGNTSWPACHTLCLGSAYK